MSLLAKFKLKGGQAAPAAPPPRRQDAYDAAQAQQDRQLAREQELEKLANSLGPEFYDDKYDHVRKFLTSLPGNEFELEQFLAATQADQQAKLDAVSSRLSREVMANYSAFIDGMRQISEIDMDISRAGIQVSNSLRKLGGAKESLVMGTLGITYRRRRRERLFESRARLQWLRSLVAVDSEVAKRVAEHQFAEAVAVVVDAQTRLREPAARSFLVVAGANAVVPSAAAGGGASSSNPFASASGSSSNSSAGAAKGAASSANPFGSAPAASASSGKDHANPFGSSSSPPAATASNSSSSANPFGAAAPSSSASSSSAAVAPALSSAASAGLKARIDGAMETLRDRVDRTLDQLCIKFDPVMYGACLLAYRDMDEAGVRSSLAASAAAGGGSGAGAASSSSSSGSSSGGSGGPNARIRAGTVLDDGSYGGLGLPSGSDGPNASSGSGGGGSNPFGPDHSDGPLPHTAGASLLAEVGSSLAAAAAAQASGVLAIKGISGPDSNLAALPARVQAAALKAIKSVSKDVVIDVLLKDARARWEAEEKAEAARARQGDFGASGDSDDEDHAAGGGDGEDELDVAAALEKMTVEPGLDASSSSKAAANKESAAKEYARRRSEMRQRPFSDLCASVPCEDIPAAALRVAAAMVHVMHSHYTLLQWHRAPLDPRNNYEECEFLHRCAADDEVEEGGDDDKDSRDAAVKAAASRLTGKLPGPLKLDGPAFLSVLSQLRPHLLKGRWTVWQHMQQRFAGLLFSAVGAAGVTLPVERLSQCLIVARDLMSVGLEYIGYGHKGSGVGPHTGPASGAAASAAVSGVSTAPGAAAAAAAGVDSDPCNTLRGSLRLLCSQQMDAVHSDAFDRLKGLLSKELWVRVPMTEQAMISVMTEAQAGLRHKFSKAASAALAAATAALKGPEALLDKDSGSGNGDGDVAGGGGGGSAGVNRCYSDGASLFASWLDRGNPFGWVALGTSDASPGATVLPVPRIIVDDDDDEDYEEEEEEEEDASPSGASPATPNAASAAATARAKRTAAARERRAAARLLRHIHGDGYTLEVGLGRGSSLGFPAGLASDGSGADASGAGAGGKDRDEDEDVSDDEYIDESATADDSEDDDVDDDDVASGRRVKKGGKSRHAADGDAAFAAGPAGALGGQHQHVVTAAALNGFAKAVGRYLLLMEVLPTVSADAFTGLARLFGLYLYTVATLFLRPPALRQLFDIPEPAPTASDRDRIDPNAFDYCDGSALAIAARVMSLAEEARAAERSRGMPAGRSSRRTGGIYDASGTAGDDVDGDAAASSHAAGGSGDGSSSPSAGSGGKRDPRDDEHVTLYGTRVYLRGLRAMAQAQGLHPDHYISRAGAGDGALLSGNAYNSDAVYLTLRRALQQIGSELASGVRMGTGSASVLAEGSFAHDSATCPRGFMPEVYVRLQQSVEIEGEGVAHGINERMTAMESLDFLLEVLGRVRGRIQAHLPPAQAPSVAAFYARSVLVCTQLKALAYHSLVPRLLPESGAIPNMVASVKWESVKDAMEISPYAGAVTAPLQRVASLLNDRVASGGLPAVSRLGIWSAVLSHVMERFVEAYSRVKRCSVPGRGLMTLDVGHTYAYATRAGPTLAGVLSRDKSYVDGYISAYYLESESDLLTWVIQQRSAYALRHMRAILLNGPIATLKKKQLKEIQNAIDAMYLLPSDNAGAGGPINLTQAGAALTSSIATGLSVTMGVSLGPGGGGQYHGGTGV